MTEADFAWEHHPDLRMPRANLMACAYNAAVNYGSERATKKIGGLLDAINWFNRAEGRIKLGLLVEAKIIESFTPCSPQCHVRPGGLFHVAGCENDYNHSVYRQRQQKAREVLPGGSDGNAGWRAASVTLVGSSAQDAGDWREASRAIRTIGRTEP